MLRFANAGTLSSGAAAVQILGQANFTSTGPALSASRMANPTALATEWGLSPTFTLQLRQLWVADLENRRVLRFEFPLGAGNGPAASGVLGQPDFLTSVSVSATTATGLNRPTALAVEGNGRLWVADASNYRVLRYDAASLKANGAAANGVLLQTSFTSAVPVGGPKGLCVSLNGRLYISQGFEDRVLWFNDAAGKANGGTPDGVLGQPDFTTHQSGSGFIGMRSPRGLSLDPYSGQVWVSNIGTGTIQRYTPSIESRITSFGFTPQSKFNLTITARGGEFYDIRSSPDLLDWSTVERSDSITGTGLQTMTWTAPAVPDGPGKFYRLQTP